MTNEAGIAPPSSGRHDRATWVGLLCTLAREARSGVVQLRFGKSWKRFDVVLGGVVGYGSDRDDDALVKALVAAAPDARGDLLQQGVAASLEWATGSWTFQPAPAIEPDSIDPALLPDPNVLSGLWLGTMQHVAMDEAMPAVTAVETFARAGDFDEWFPLLGVQAPLDELPAALAGGCAMDALYRRIPDRSGNLVKLLWMLQQGGLFQGQLDHRIEMGSLLEGLRADDSQTEIEVIDDEPSMIGIPAVEPEPEPSYSDEPAPVDSTRRQSTPASKRPRDPVSVVRRDYQARMGKDYYTFLSLEPGAEMHAIERRCRQLSGRWQAAMRSRAVPQDVKDVARELSTGVQLVYRTLADPKRRAEYDRRLAAGQAPVLRPIQGATHLSTPAAPRPQRPEAAVGPSEGADGGPPTLMERVDHFVEAGQWKTAAGLLKEARLVNPSDPDVLAQLGWVTWQMDKDREAAEEFLQLAVAFDRNHLDAVIYLGKVALEAGDDDEAIRWLNRVMELDRSQRWARRALRKLTPSPTDGGKQSGLKFWRKGD